MSRKTLIVSVAVGLFGLAAFAVLNFGSLGSFGAVKTVTAADGEVKLDISKIDDGNAHHYIYKKDGGEIKFFVIKSPDGVMRAAFDACDVCYPERKGYSQDGEYMVCNNCGQRFHSNRVNVVEGGCNPAPLKRQIAGNLLIIKVQDILPGARFF